MLQQKVLRFRIHGRALPVARYPRPANLHAMMRAVDIAVTGAPDGAARGLFNDGRILRLAALARRAPIWIWMGNFLNARSNRMTDAPLCVVGGQHGSSLYREVFAVSADLRELPHQGIIEPVVP